MVNQTEVTEIPFQEGRGFVVRPNGGFMPGEFKSLNNVEIRDGRIKSRRNIVMPNYSAVGDYSQKTGLRHIGFWQDWAIYTNDTELLAYSPSSNVSGSPYGAIHKLADVSSLHPYTYGSITYEGFHNIVGFFTYNGYNYLLVFSNVSRTDSSSGPDWSDPAWYTDGVSAGFKLYRFADEPDGLAPPVVDPTAFYLVGGTNFNSGLTLPGIFVPGLKWDSATSLEFDFMNCYFNNFFFFKDRLFICNQHGVYFSKPFDPTDFTVVNDGGYFKTGEIVNYAIADTDRIYLFGKNSITVVTYADDPNVDAVQSTLSNTMGALHACVHRGIVYFVNNEGVFTINNNNIEKVMDTNLQNGKNLFTRQRLIPFGEYLVLHRTYEYNSDGLGKHSSGYQVRTNLIEGSSKFGNLNSGGVAPHRLEGQAVYLSPVWERYTPVSANSTYTIVTPTGMPVTYSNPEAIELTKTVDLGVQGIRSSDNYNQKYPIVTGKSYSISTYLKLKTLALGGAGSFTIQLDFYNDTNTKIDGVALSSDTGLAQGAGVIAFNALNPGNPASLDTWRRYGFNFKVSDPDITKMRIIFYLDSMQVTTQAEFAGIMLEESDVIGSFISSALAGYQHKWKAGIFYPTTNVFQTVYSNGAFQYFKNLYPNMFTDGNDPNDLVSPVYTTFFMNVDTGSVHVVDYSPVFDRVPNPDVFTGYISDIVVNTNSNDDLPTGDTLFILTSDHYGDGLALPNQYVAFMNYEIDTTKCFDHIVDLNGVSELLAIAYPKVSIELDSFSPDDNEYLMKKFRNFELMGRLPGRTDDSPLNDKLKFDYTVDNLNSGITPIELYDQDPVDGKTIKWPVPHRVGINQRGRSVTLKLNVTNSGPQTAEFDFLEITSMRLLWTPTGRSALNNKYAVPSG